MNDEGAGSKFHGDAFMPPTPVPAKVSAIESYARQQTIRPMTNLMLIKAYHEDPDGLEILVAGRPVSKAILVGRVVNKITRMECCSFNIDDGTGVLEVCFWFTGPTDSKMAWTFQNGDYVKVCGLPAHNESFLRIQALDVRKVVNFNDITHHMLYCVYCYLDILRINRKTASSSNNTAMVAGASSVDIIPLVVNQDASPVDKILAMLRDPAYRDIEHGVSLKLLRSSLCMSGEEIMSIVNDQIRLGEVYTTVDDFHFKSCA